MNCHRRHERFFAGLALHKLQNAMEPLVRQLIEKLTVYEDKFTVEFKSGVTWMWMNKGKNEQGTLRDFTVGCLALVAAIQKLLSSRKPQST